MKSKADDIKDWPELQSLMKKGLIEYNKNNQTKFSVTELGKSVIREIDLKLN